MAARLHHPLRGLKNLTKTNRPPNLNQKRTFTFSVPLPPPPPPAAAARGRAPSLPLSALRSLAQHLVSSSKRLFSTQPVTGAAPLKHTHLPSDLASRIRVGRGAMPGFGGFHSSSAGRFGPGGLGRGPMGPGVRGGFSRGVGNVGLGTARGYASMARPLFDGVVGNTPLALRALANALEDQAENLKAPHRSLHHSSKASSSKKQRSSAHPYLKPASKKTTSTSTSTAVAAAVEESSSASDDHTLFFSPSPAQTLPTASSPSSTTTLFLPFSLNSTTHTFPPSHYPSLSHLASTHREAYQTHALRVERLIKAMEDKGVFLDGGVREEEVKDWEEEVLGVKVVFEGRSEEEVRVILGKQHQGGEGEWWFLDEQEQTSSRDASVGSSSESLIYPTIALPLPITINPDSIFASASNSLFEDQVLEERAEWSASSSPSLSEDASSSSSLSSSSLSSSASNGLGSGTGSFISEFEQDEDLDDADWLSEYSGGSGASSSMLVLMEEQARSVEEEEEMGTDLFSSAYWSEMGGNGEELR